MRSRDKKYIKLSFPVLRDFGGVEREYENAFIFDEFVLFADSDEEALLVARQQAKDRKMIVMSVLKLIYNRRLTKK